MSGHFPRLDPPRKPESTKNYRAWVSWFRVFVAFTLVFGLVPLRMSGQGPAVDPSGNLYLSTGNGDVELALVEWKYTEEYINPTRPNPAKDIRN